MRILITGATGFIGTALTRAARARGHDVLGLSRAGASTGEGVARAWSLGEPVPVGPGDAVDAAIHLAHDFTGAGAAALTQSGTLAAVAQLAQAGVSRQFFFSSYSASAQAVSLYGRTKHQMEQALAHRPDMTIVRPGLVMGDGGIYARIAGVARKFPIVPLPDGGRGLVPVIGIDALCAEVLNLCESGAPMAQANIFEPELRTLRQLVLDIAAKEDHRVRIMPLPSRVFLAALDIVALLPFRLPVNADNLRGFIANQASSHQSTLAPGK